MKLPHRPHRDAGKRLPAALVAVCIGVSGPGAARDAMAFEVTPEGRLHLDYAAYDADAEPHADDLIVRRAVFGLDGKFGDDWSFEIAYEFASDGEIRPGDGHFRDVALEYEGWGAADVTVGQFKLPFGLEELSSSNNILFVERALPVDAFAPSRRMGIGLDRHGDRYTFTAMAFGSSLDGDDRGRGAAARFTVAPVHADDTVVHLGIAAVVEHPRSDVDFDASPESRVADVDFVNTGDIDGIDRIDRIGIEAAWKSGPVSAQAEWMRAALGRDSGRADADLQGWYVAGSWILTGESRAYDDGAFKGAAPGRRGGAWELTARYSHLDLDAADIRGGEERNRTLGLNYYANEHLRIMANYIQVRSRRRGATDDPDIFQIRAQLVF